MVRAFRGQIWRTKAWPHRLFMVMQPGKKRVELRCLTKGIQVLETWDALDAVYELVREAPAKERIHDGEPAK